MNYSFEYFSFSNSPFFIKIANNSFSFDELNININDSFHRLNIEGSIHFSNHTSIKNNFFAPNIMGPFSYFPSLECNHAILSMKSDISGSLHFNGDFLNFDDGVAYIEKDWGTSFPRSYVWCQSNEFLAFPANSNFLLAPSKGQMKREILESISSKIDVQLKENGKILFSNSGINSGLEIVI